MSTRYHISPTTGKPNICRAKTVGGCRFNSDGSIVEHFDSKEQAQEHIEKSLSEQYSSSSSKSKSGKDGYDRLYKALLNSNGKTYGSVQHFVAEEVPDFTVEEIVERIDYREQALLENNGQHYIADFYGYFEYEPLNVRSVKKVTSQQLDSETELVDTIDDPEVVNMVKEFDELSKIEDGAKHGFIYDGSVNDQRIVRIESYMFSNRSIEREDGSTIHSFAIEPEGDTSLVDSPAPVRTNVTLWENDERQNARKFDIGHAIYDTRIQKGIVLVHRSGSEGGESSSFIFEGDQITKDDDYQSFYMINGTGETIDAEHWKYTN